MRKQIGLLCELVCLLFALAAAFLLAGCRSTPETEAVTSKNDGAFQAALQTTAEDGAALAIGDTFTMLDSVEGEYTCRLDSVQMSDNLLTLGVDPSEISQHDSPSYINETGSYVEFSLSSDLDTATGQLADPWRFVVVEVTMTNIDAITQPVPENDDGTRDDSYYTFLIESLEVYDADKEMSFKAKWHAGTGDYDSAVGGTNGSNYYILRPGESLTYQLGFLVASGDGDFSQFYLTEAGVYSEDVSYVSLDLSGEEDAA